jgi:tetratricopeptide (TPR) repeat protein
MAQSKALLRAKKKKALAFIEAERFQDAQILYTEICRTEPRDADAWFMLGAIYGRLNQFDEAIPCSIKAVALQPDNIDAHYNLAQAYMHLVRHDEAAASYAAVLRLQPDHVEACNTLGFILKQQGNLQEAQGYFQKVLSMRPDHAEAYANLGEVYRECSDMEKAEHYYREALCLKPGIVKAQTGLAAISFINGRLDEAVDWFNTVQENDPEHLAAVAGLVQVHDKRGEFEQAQALLAPWIAGGNKNFAIATSYAKIARRIGQVDKAIALMEEALLQSDVPRAGQMAVHYQLGKAYDEAGDYDRAFSHYRAANDLSPSHTKPEHYLSRMEAMMRLFTPDFLARMPRAANASDRPVFIVGMPRSGTTLTEQILASHPAVHGAGELSDMAHLTTALPSKFGSAVDYPECLDGRITQAFLDETAQAYLGTLQQLSPTALRVTDKMPHNFQHLGLIELLFPHARVIHCMREPMDTCLSIYTYQFSAAHGYATDLTNLGGHYLKYQALMQHWKQVLSIPILEVRYEDMVADQERVSRELVNFCGLEWDEKCLSFYENKRIVNTLSYDQVRRPIYKKSVARWKNYEAHLAPLRAALGLEDI